MRNRTDNHSKSLINSHSNTFNIERKQLQRWPYVTNLVDGTLDPRLIEGRGKQLLFQALSNKTVLAFVGSGLSTAYGRLSWWDWQDRQVERLGEIAKTFNECSEHSLILIERLHDLLSSPHAAEQKIRNVLEKKISKKRKNKTHNKQQKIYFQKISAFLRIKMNEIRFRSHEIASLSETLSLLKSAKSIPGGELPPVVFQAAEKLKEALERNDDLFAKDRPKKHEDHPSETIAKMLLAARPGFAFAGSPGPSKDVDDIVEVLEELQDLIDKSKMSKTSKTCVKEIAKCLNIYKEVLTRFLRLTQV